MNLFKSSIISILIIAILNFGYGALAGEPRIQAGLYMAIVVTTSSAVLYLLVVGLMLLYFKLTGRTRDLKSTVISFIVLFVGICATLLMVQFLMSGATDLLEDGIVYFLPSALVFSALTSYLEFRVFNTGK
ncbi:MAG: hypothetical protein R2820_06440 [Cyclobacteriaceae bacterium]